jgi:hypothetical protein
MKSLGLIGPYYANTEEFVNELQKHLKIAKVCTSNNLRGCWPYDKITLSSGNEYNIAEATTGKVFLMPSNSTQNYSTPNVGIITADGTPMILSFNTKCEALDPATTYSWSSSDNKPVTNATASCVSAIFEINGTSKPNKFSTDVVGFNINGLFDSCATKIGGKCYSSVFTPSPLTKAECEAQKGALGISQCCTSSNCNTYGDSWAGAVAQCGGVNNLPTTADLAKIASAIYGGNPSIGAKEDKAGLTYTSGTATALGLPEPTFWLWSNEEISSNFTYARNFYPTASNWTQYYRYYDGNLRTICVTD